MTATTINPAVAALLQPALDAVEERAARGGVRFILGCGAPGAPLAEPDERLVVIPALGPHNPPAWALERLGRVPALGLLDRSEAMAIRAAYPDAPAVYLGFPRPARRTTTTGVDMGCEAPEHLLVAWAESQGDVPEDGPGVTWIQGLGAVPVARALMAWAEGRSVVALPGTMRHPLLRAGGVLYADGPLEVVEATAYLCGLPALVASLSSRGLRTASRLPSPAEMLERLNEVVALAAGGTPR